MKKTMPQELSRMSSEPDPSLVARLARHGQEHLLRWWGELDEAGRARLVAEIEAIDLDGLTGLVGRLVEGGAHAAPDPARVAPVAVDRLPRTDAERVARRHTAERGEALLAAGEVAVVLVAGGQGT
ncbi:MAG TPA: UDPGP type 1 family protein, partial [Isosphaeraceae bacterium]